MSPETGNSFVYRMGFDSSLTPFAATAACPAVTSMDAPSGSRRKRTRPSRTSSRDASGSAARMNCVPITVTSAWEVVTARVRPAACFVTVADSVPRPSTRLRRPCFSTRRSTDVSGPSSIREPSGKSSAAWLPGPAASRPSSAPRPSPATALRFPVGERTWTSPWTRPRSATTGRAGFFSGSGRVSGTFSFAGAAAGGAGGGGATGVSTRGRGGGGGTGSGSGRGAGGCGIAGAGRGASGTTGAGPSTRTVDFSSLRGRRPGVASAAMNTAAAASPAAHPTHAFDGAFGAATRTLRMRRLLARSASATRWRAASPSSVHSWTKAAKSRAPSSVSRSALSSRLPPSSSSFLR